MAVVDAAQARLEHKFSTSDYLEKNTPRENVVAMIKAAKEAGP
jgi:hypothetical protein